MNYCEFKPNVKNLKVLTPNGYKPFRGIMKFLVPQDIIKITTESGNFLEVTNKHILVVGNKEILANTLNIGDCVETITGLEKISDIKKIEKDYVYELIDVEGSIYYTNGILSHNCKFLGSSSQLIEADKLEELTPTEPIDISHYSGALQIYEQPIEGEKYILGVDPGKGSGNDYSVIQVLKILSEFDIVQVAIFRSNYIKIEKFVDIAIGISDFYNNCEVMAESNDVGELFCSELWNKKNFDRLLNCDKKGLGIRATRKSKLEGNMLLKKYIENNYLRISDKRTIYELSRYIEISPNVYHAEGQNENDDCVSALIWGLFYLTTSFFDPSEIVKDSDDSNKNTFSGFAVMDGNFVGNFSNENMFNSDDYNYNDQFGFL